MKSFSRTLTVFAVLVASSTVAHCDAAAAADDDIGVPRKHWAYEALFAAVPAEIWHRQVFGFYSGPPLLLTRYQFAIAIAKGLRTSCHLKNRKLPPDLEFSDGLDIDVSERCDAFAALVREFAPELRHFGIVAPSGDEGFCRADGGVRYEPLPK